MKYYKFLVTLLPILFGFPLLVFLNVDSQQDNDRQLKNKSESKVLHIEIEDFISSATSDNIATAIQRISDTNDQIYSAILITLDTPGGSLDATLDIIDQIQQSPVPIITYVYPQGKSAWSAGTIILLAGNYAAMAPFTTIGSAQPVLGNEPINDTKITNAITGKLITLANLHERNATQATRFVTHNDNLTPQNALQNNIIETIASDPQELLGFAHNSTVQTLDGKRILDTANAELVEHQPGLRVLFVGFLANPLISSVFLTIGFLSLIYGLMSPGFGVEIVGAILIIFGLLGQGFDINWAAFALLAIGVGLLAYELYSPSFGILGIAGIAVIAVGAILMITQPVGPLLIREEHLKELANIAALIIAPFAALMGIVIYKVWQSKKKGKKVDFTFYNDQGIAVDDISIDRPGFIIIGGEYWKAKPLAEMTIRKGEKVKIVDKKGPLLIVDILT